MLNTFCVQNVCCNIFYLSAGGIAGAARKLSPKASGATTPAKGIAGKEFCSNLLFCIYLGYFTLVFLQLDKAK